MKIVSFILTLLPGFAVGLNNGAAIKPPMGWNSYYAYSCSATETQYQDNAQALIALGLQAVGYNYLVVDCGWQADARTPSGLINWDATRIPSGIPALSQYVHTLNLQFGLQSDAGYFSCDSNGGGSQLIGSLGHESIDATTFTDWGVDYLKYDSCFAVSPSIYIEFEPPPNLEQNNYGRMRDALSKIDNGMVYAVCDWGIQSPERWAGAIANSWRIANDFGSPPSFEDLKRIINQLASITTFTRPGSWNDLDLLEVGNTGMSVAEWKTHFVFWGASKSPLFISTDLTSLSKEALNILLNEQVIAVNQDPLGVSVSFIRRYTDDHDVWAGLLADGSKVAVFINWMNVPQTITIDLSDLSFASADVTDLWYGNDLGTVYGWTTAHIEAHGVLMYKFSNAVEVTPKPSKVYYASDSQNILAGGAYLRTLIDGTVVVGNIGYGGTLTFVNIDGGSDGGTKLVKLSYINADFTFFNTDCSNCRRVEVSVNGRTPVVAEMPISGQDWNYIFYGYPLSLDGFVPGTNNQVTFSNLNAWGPDMSSMAMEVEFGSVQG